MTDIENKENRLNSRIPISTKIAAIEYAKKQITTKRLKNLVYLRNQ